MSRLSPRELPVLRVCVASLSFFFSLAVRISPVNPSLIVHGGAFAVPDSAIEACKSGARDALAAGWKILSSGGSALDAVEAAVVSLEDNPQYDAGTGSHLNRDGHVSLDAIVMDGRSLRSGAVAAVERIRNPIRLARAAAAGQSRSDPGSTAELSLHPKPQGD